MLPHKEKRVFIEVISKDLDMSMLSGIIPVGPKCKKYIFL
jgi:hypothetical protein